MLQCNRGFGVIAITPVQSRFIFIVELVVCLDSLLFYTKRTKVFQHVQTVPHGRNMHAT